jgi:hypothetical protein
MTDPKHLMKRLLTTPVTLALSLSLSSGALLPAAMAAPGDTNSINNGRDVAGGTYYNTADNKTTFINNRGSDGLVVGAGTTVRGLEVLNGLPTGNGGTLHFYAPGSMVRLDGNVDVSGLIRNGSYIGNGGRVFVDSAMLFQNGSIFANGLNGGSVQFNVGSAMFGPSSRVEAQGFGGLAGTISVNAVGTVDLRNGAVFDASGRSINTQTLSDNVNVNVVGSLVNNQGIIRANAINVGGDGHVALLGSNGALATAEAFEAGRTTATAPTVSADSGTNGGVIRLVSNGQTRTDCVDCAADKGQAEGIVTLDEANSIKALNASLIATSEGNVVNSGTVQANGAPNTNTNPALGLNGGNGGKIIIASTNDVNNTGLIEAKGGKGANYFNPENLGQVPGQGGNGGLVTISALRNINNTGNGVIDASGGQGGASSSSLTDDTVGFSDTRTNDAVIGFNPLNGNPLVGDANNQVAIAAYNAETVVDGGIRAGNGGNGGVVALSYGNALTNDSTISANGGNGGQGLAVRTDALADGGVRQTAQSVALSVGGAGGFGGNGGLIALSGPSNPTGTGTFQANGGRGGDGGNATARAAALAIGSGYNDFDENALASAGAAGGQGGAGGNGGLILTPDVATANPASFSTSGGAGGDAGLASAEARTLAVDAAFAQAIAQGRNGSNAFALGTTINIPNTNPITDFTPGSTASVVRDAFQNRSIYNLDRTGTEALVTPFGSLGRGSSQAIHTTTPFLKTADGLVEVLAGVSPGPGNTPAVDYANAAADVTLTGSGAAGANGFLAQTQNNEVIVTGNTALLLSKGGSPANSVNGIINDAITNGAIRFVNTTQGQPIRHALVSDVSGNSLSLDKPADGSLNGLTSLTVNHLGSVVETEDGTVTNDLTIPDGTQWTVGLAPESGNVSSGGGHASLTTKTNLITEGSAGLYAYGSNTGGSLALTGSNVLLTSNRTDASFTTLSTNTGNTAFHGGAISVKADGTVWNDPGINDDTDTTISANGNNLGGTVRLQAGVLLANNGNVFANGGQQGGVVVGKSGLVALNQQTINANGGQQGGYVRWHGNAIAVNGPDVPGEINSVGYPGDITATGGVNGGVIKLTSGGPVPDGYTNAETDGLTNLLLNQAGFGITQGTLQASGTSNGSLITLLPNGPLPLGSAINAGNLNTQGGETDAGVIDIAGNGLAFATETSTFNGVATGTSPVAFFANASAAGTRFIAGDGAVRAAVCDQPIPTNPETPGNPNTPPDGNPGVDPNTGLDITSFLFQNQRPYLLDRLPVPTNNKLVLRLGQPGLFLAKAYTPVTQEILNLALEEYNRELANGKTIDEALRITRLYLEQAGVDGEIASQLVEQVAAGSYKADNRVVKVLQTIANQPVVEEQPVTPVENGEPLRQ